MPVKKKIRPTFLTELLSIGIVIGIMVWLFSIEAPSWLKGIIGTIAVLFWLLTELGVAPALVTWMLQKTEENRGRTKSDISWKVTYEEVKEMKNDKVR